MKFDKFLKSKHACKDALAWIGERTEERAWHECECGNWLLWYASVIGIDRKLVVLAACTCAETALKHVAPGELRPQAAIDAARRWCEGRATIAEVRAAADASYSAAADREAHRSNARREGRGHRHLGFVRASD